MKQFSNRKSSMQLNNRPFMTSTGPDCQAIISALKRVVNHRMHLAYLRSRSNICRWEIGESSIGHSGNGRQLVGTMVRGIIYVFGRSRGGKSFGYKASCYYPETYCLIEQLVVRLDQWRC